MTNTVKSRPIIGLDPAAQAMQIEISALTDAVADVLAILGNRHVGTPIPSRQQIFEVLEERFSPAWEEMLRRSGRPFAVRVARDMTVKGTIKFGEPVEVPSADEPAAQASDLAARDVRKKVKKP